MSRFLFEVQYMRKRMGLMLFLCVLLLMPKDVWARDDGYTFKTFHVSAYVRKNAVIDVTERVSVAYHEPRHGFVQEIPTSYRVKRDINGKKHSAVMHVGVRDISVKGAPYQVDTESGCRVIKIGDKDQQITGTKDYVVTYTLDLGDDRVKAFDEFFYSLIGGGWDTDMKDVTFDVTFEKPVNNTKIHVYAGTPGSRNESRVSVSEAQNTIKGSVPGGLSDGEALTVYARFPEGYFEGVRKDIPYVTLCVLVIFCGCMVVALRMFFKRRGKDRVVRQIEVRPPEGISSAEVGYIIDESADDKDLLSLIVYFAEKGYLEIVESEKDQFVLHKTASLPEEAPPYQKVFFEGLFHSETYRNTEEDRRRVSESLDRAKLALRGHFTGKRSLRDDRSFLRKRLILLVQSAGVMLMGLSNDMTIPGSLILGIFIGVLEFLILNIIRNRAFKKKIVLILQVFFAGVIYLAVCAGMSAYAAYPEYVRIACLLMTGNLLVVTGISDRSPFRCAMTGQLLGFRDFIKKADVDRINRLVEADPEYFYKVLPYAYVFGLTDRWIKQFEHMVVETPAWYRGYAGEPYTLYRLGRNTERCVQNVSRGVETYRNAVERANIQNYTSSGGGFSGGGAGGGGGHSW